MHFIDLCCIIPLRDEQSGDQIPVKARLSATVQTGLRAQPASHAMGTESFPGVKSGLLPFCAFVACYRVTFIFNFSCNKSIIYSNLTLYNICSFRTDGQTDRQT